MSSEPRRVGGYREAFESARDEALALPRDKVRRINVDIWDAVTTARGCVPKIAALRAEMAQKCGGLDLQRVDDLDRYALAAVGANTRYLIASRPPPRVQEMTARLKEIRSLLILDVQIADKRRRVRAECLEKLSGRSGALNTMGDVFVLCSFVRNNWSAFEGASGLTLAELDAAELLAEEAQGALAQKPHEGKDLAKLADMRRRVFTLFFNAYDEARRGVAFLRWRQGDAEEIAPSLLRDRGKRKALAAAAAVAPVAAAPLPWESSPVAAEP